MELRWNIVFSLILTKAAGEILSEWIPAWAILKSCNQNSFFCLFFLAGQCRTGSISFRFWTKRRSLQDEFPCDNRKLLLACRQSRQLALVKKSDWSFWKSSWLRVKQEFWPITFQCPSDRFHDFGKGEDADLGPLAPEILSI